MGSVRGARPPSNTAYFVALAGILSLLLLLCCYFIYFCVKRVRELMKQGLPEPVASVRPPPKSTSYPVQPEVRESATAMARLCQMPSRSDAVFPSQQPSNLPPPRVLSRPQTPKHVPQCPQLTVEPPT
ncbi:uncharacterized protein LOC121727806 [Aricia agestis]|uniref:uncharacterized protein LOC121727806 n=1 Tax=Aricia agestis TaxID=91739 RepID=UPI001C206850|nr:uncharacterized protein LOC121727806 [Aricia agestis]